MHAEDTWVRQALEAGANGYLLKNVGVQDIHLHAALPRMVRISLRFTL